MGHYALEGCRLEKGYRAFGHDLGPDITPLEAGLGFTVGWQTDFVGRDALASQKEAGVTRRLVGLRRIDDIATETGQGNAVDLFEIGGARFGELSGHARDLGHRAPAGL